MLLFCFHMLESGNERLFMESHAGDLSLSTPASNGVLTSTPLRLVIALCLLSLLPEFCWMIGLGLESGNQGFWPTFWRAINDVVFVASLFITPLATLVAIALTVVSMRFRRVSGGALVVMWLFILLAGTVEIAHLHGYIGLKKRMTGHTLTLTVPRIEVLARESRLA
jgi:hypothetical protein